jgi:hypothetical protein
VTLDFGTVVIGKKTSKAAMHAALQIWSAACIAALDVFFLAAHTDAKIPSRTLPPGRRDKCG